MKNSNQFVKNTAMLYIMTAAKVIFPLLTLPYLTRVLTMEGYAVVSYTKSFMQYFQLFVDFGFILSATKAIVNVKNDSEKISEIVSNTILARFILAVIGLAALMVFVPSISILKKNALFVFLSYGVVLLSCFLTDYLFQGIEQMQEISIRFVLMKGISTALTFVVVHSDADILLIPILDILSSIAAVFLVMRQMKKYDVRLIKPSVKTAWCEIKESFAYFASNIATTAFGALNTLVIGMYLPEAQIALWSVALQIISAIQVMYSPIIDSLYPQMVKTKSKKLIRRILLIFMPLILIGCIIVFVLSEFALTVVGGEKYVVATPVLRMLIPILFFSFPAMLLGWSGLGAIGKVKETTATTIFAAVVQVIGLGGLILTHHFTIMSVAALRTVSELCLFGSRAGFCIRYRQEFEM